MASNGFTFRGRQGGSVAVAAAEGSNAGFTWVNPIADWGPIGNLGYYIHKGRVYWQGGIGANQLNGAYDPAFLVLPPEIRPATTIAFTAWGDFTNMDDVQPTSVLMQVDPSGVMEFLDPVPTLPGLTFVGYVFHDLSWDLPTATLDDPSWTDLGPFLAYNAAASDNVFQVDSQIAAHGSRLHLRGHVGIPNLGATTPTPSETILDALSTAGHTEWSPDGTNNSAFPQQIGDVLLTLHLPFTGGARPVQGYVEKGFDDSVALFTQSWGVRRTIHLSYPTNGLLETINSGWRSPEKDPFGIGGYYLIASGSYDVEEPNEMAVVGNWLMPAALGDFGLDPADPSEQVGLWIGVLDAHIVPYFYKAVYTKQGHYHWLTLWAYDSGAPDGVGDGLRYRKVYETAHEDLTADPGPQKVTIGSAIYYLVRGNLSMTKSEDVPDAIGSVYDDKIAYALAPSYFSSGFPGWALDDGGGEGTANLTLRNMRDAGAPGWNAGRLEGTSGEGGTYWYGSWRATVGGGLVPSGLNPYATPGSSWVLDGKGWFIGGEGVPGTIVAGDAQSGVVRWPKD